MGKKIRILLADDHTLLRSALCLILEQDADVEVVADVDCASEALRLTKELAPDVVLMDIGMPGMDGIAATRQLVAASPDTKVLALTTHAERYYVLQMFKAGAKGYMIKSGNRKELMRAIHSVAQNKTYISPELASAVVDTMRRKAPALEFASERLGQRERAVLALVAEGKSSEEIAARLHIAAGTVVAHRRNIMRKLGLHSVAELTKYAIREGLTSS